MALKMVILGSLLAVGQAAYLAVPSVQYTAAPTLNVHSPPAITSQGGNILRNLGGIQQVATQHKTIDTPYSSVSKADIRVTNDLAYPALHAGPILATGSAPVLKAASSGAVVGVGHGLIGVAYSSAPAVSHMTFDGLGISYAY